jgi:WXG100 family type VII secretion target
MANDFVIKASPDELRGKAGEVRNIGKNISGLMSTMDGQVKTLQQYWKAKSGEDFAVKYGKVSKNIQDALMLLEKNAKTLEDAADAYTQANQQTETNVNALTQKDIFN